MVHSGRRIPAFGPLARIHPGVFVLPTPTRTGDKSVWGIGGREMGFHVRIAEMVDNNGVRSELVANDHNGVCYT